MINPTWLINLSTWFVLLFQLKIEILSSIMQVFFCSPSTKPLVFRPPVEMDYAGSHLRTMIFDTLQRREVDMKLIRGDTKDGEKWVLDDTSNRLMDWQKSDALEHWRGMCLL